jgi:flagellar motor switch protein FliM
VRLHLEMDERGGIIELLLPYSTIEPIRELLLQNFMGEKFGRDSIWEHHLAEQLWVTDFSLELKMPQMTEVLKNVLSWQVGTQIVFNCGPTDSLPIHCYDNRLFTGKIGQKSGCIAVRVDDVLLQKGEK